MSPSPEETFYENQERREDERAQREKERDAREAHERAAEKEREAKAKREEHAREAGAAVLAKVQPRNGLGYTAGGGPSFFIPITEGIELPTTEVPSTGVKYTNPKVVTGPFSLMGQKAISPGSVWEIFSIYVKSEMGLKIAPNATPFTGTSTAFTLTATLYRNTQPIWIGSANATPHAGADEGSNHVEAYSQMLIATEFSNPVVLGAGESLFLTIEVEWQFAWESATKPSGNLLFYSRKGSGLLRYAVTSTAHLEGR